MHESKAGVLVSDKTRTGFWKRVEKMDGGCWYWKGTVSAEGYGTVMLTVPGARHAGRRKQKAVRAHRLSWFLTYGEWPAEFTADGNPGVLLHICNTRDCVNPRHLRLGTHGENSAHMADSGRAPSGEEHYAQHTPGSLARGSQNGRARLTEEQVAEIRRKFTGARGQQSALAREYGMPVSAIHLIVRNAVWRHVALSEPYKKHMAKDITDADRLAAFERGVERGGEEACWPWRGPTSSNGYPIVLVGAETISAMRIAYAMVHGSVPAGQTVHRTCGNKLCVNPRHITTMAEGCVSSFRIGSC